MNKLRKWGKWLALPAAGVVGFSTLPGSSQAGASGAPACAAGQARAYAQIDPTKRFTELSGLPASVGGAATPEAAVNIVNSRWFVGDDLYTRHSGSFCAALGRVSDEDWHGPDGTLMLDNRLVWAVFVWGLQVDPNGGGSMTPEQAKASAHNGMIFWVDVATGAFLGGGSYQ